MGSGARASASSPMSDDGFITCYGCRRPFYFSTALRAQFTERGWALPRRCGPCRGEKARWNEANPDEVNIFDDVDQRRKLYRKRLRQQRKAC